MYPWLWIWTPQFHYPFSGSVAQRIEPDVNWFFDSIPESAGIGSVEKEIFKTNSYGDLLGIIIDALLFHIENEMGDAAELGGPIKKLKDLNDEITRIKENKADAYAAKAKTLMLRLRRLHKEKFDETLSDLKNEAFPS